MFSSVVVYILLMMFMMGLSWCASHAKHHRYIGAVSASLAFAVFFGIRYMVGTDFYTYYINYEDLKLGYQTDEFLRWEIGFRAIFIFFARLGCHYSLPFGVIAFIQCSLIYIALRKQYKMWTFIPFTLILTCIWISYANIMRHMLAFSIFIVSIRFLADKQYLKYCLCVTLAFLFHNSAVLLYLLIIPYMFKNEYFSNIKLQFILLGIALVLMNINMVQNIFELFSTAISFMKYDDYLTSHYAEFNEDIRFGMGPLSMLIIAIFLIAYSNKMKYYYASSTVSIMYDLYFIGIFIHFAFIRMFLLQRLNYYFYSFEFIIGALTLGYLYKSHGLRIFIILATMFLMLFLGKLLLSQDIGSYRTFFSA